MENYEYGLGHVKDVTFLNLTPARFRDLALQGMVASGPGVIQKWMPTVSEVEAVRDLLYSAVSSGRMIDFGHWPNELIKKHSGRAGELYYKSALGHPFSSAWVFGHTWSDPILDKKLELDEEKRTSYYLVNPFLNDKGKAVGCDFEITALETMMINGRPLLCIGDRAVLVVQLELPEDAKYVAYATPHHFRFPLQFWNEYARTIGQPEGPISAMQNSVANVCEPLLIALLLLNTKGVPQETIRAPEKLQKARARNKKPPIPSYIAVDSRAYVTAIFQPPGARSETKGGHHASPIQHLRIGHWRTYKTGERTFINDTLVNATPEMREIFKSNRMMYVNKGTTVIE